MPSLKPRKPQPPAAEPSAPSEGRVEEQSMSIGQEAAGKNGTAAGADTDFATIRAQIISEFSARAPTAPPAPAACTPVANTTLRALCQLTSTHFLVARAAGLNLANIVLSFSFSTQSINDTTAILSAAPLSGTDGAVVVQNTGLTTAQVLPGSPGLARIYAGTVRVPYYLTPPSVANPTAPLTAYWTAAGPPVVPSLDQTSRLLTRFNPVPARVATLDIPLLLTVPTVGGPGPNGWPIVLFQHGTPRTRADMLLVADSFAARGFADAQLGGQSGWMELMGLHGRHARHLTSSFVEVSNYTPSRVPHALSLKPTHDDVANHYPLLLSSRPLRRAAHRP